MKTTRKTKRKTISLDSDVCAVTMKQADKENRTLSNMVNTLLRRRFKGQEEGAAA